MPSADRLGRPPRTPNARGLDDLTPREHEVLELIAHGHSNADIARALYVSEARAKTHVAHVLSKLHLHDRAQAVVYAYETGLGRPREAASGVEPR